MKDLTLQAPFLDICIIKAQLDGGGQDENEHGVLEKLVRYDLQREKGSMRSPLNRLEQGLPTFARVIRRPLSSGKRNRDVPSSLSALCSCRGDWFEPLDRGWTEFDGIRGILDGKRCKLARPAPPARAPATPPYPPSVPAIRVAVWPPLPHMLEAM